MDVLSQLRNLNEDIENTIGLNEIVSNYIKLLNFKKSEDALLCLNSLLSKDNSNDVDVLLFRGMIHYSLNSFNDALDDFDMILSVNPNNVSAIVCRGETYRMLSQYDEALGDFGKSLEMKPDNVFALAHRGATYRMLKEYKLALQDLDKSLDIKPSNFANENRDAVIKESRSLNKTKLNGADRKSFNEPNDSDKKLLNKFNRKFDPPRARKISRKF